MIYCWKALVIADFKNEQLKQKYFSISNPKGLKKMNCSPKGLTDARNPRIAPSCKIDLPFLNNVFFSKVINIQSDMTVDFFCVKE